MPTHVFLFVLTIVVGHFDGYNTGPYPAVTQTMTEMVSVAECNAHAAKLNHLHVNRPDDSNGLHISVTAYCSGPPQQ